MIERSHYSRSVTRLFAFSGKKVVVTKAVITTFPGYSALTYQKLISNNSRKISKIFRLFYRIFLRLFGESVPFLTDKLPSGSSVYRYGISYSDLIFMLSMAFINSK